MVLINSALRMADVKSRAQRFQTSSSFTVKARTIGTSLSIPLRTSNISRSGMLLKTDKSLKIPFNINTIIEINICTKAGDKTEVIGCLGKIVRKGESSESQEFGVRIVQMDSIENELWDRYISSLER